METTTESDCRDGPWTRPWLATAEFWEQCRERKEQFDIDPATEFEAREVETTKTSEEQEASRFRFMELPAEIRMQIYYWLHLMSPVRHAQLAPWYPIPVYSHYIVSPITPESQPTDEEELTSKDVDSHVEQEMIKDMLSPFRPLSALPSNLLRANSKIYFESRIIPFKNNEFVFVNWFASGLWAAKAFTENLQLWQCAHLRFIRLEMLYRDFTSPGYEAWVKLCTSWASSVKGLRLKILITGGHLVHEAKKKQIKNGEQFMVKLRRDISIGVEKMKRLKRLELELSTEEFEDWRKIELCRVLEEELRNTGMDVTVVSTKKVRWWTRRTGTDEPLPVG